MSLGVALGVLAGAITALLSYKHNKQKRHSQLDGASRSTERHLDSSADIVKEGRTTGGTDAEIMSNLREDGLSGCFKKAVSGQCRVGAQELDGEAVLPCPRKFQGSPAASRAELA